MLPRGQEGSHELTAHHPPRPASGLCLPVHTPYLGLWDWSLGPPTRSPRRAACAPCVPRAAAAALGAALACGPPWSCMREAQVGVGHHPLTLSLTRPTSLTPWSRRRPHTTTPCTLQAPAPAGTVGRSLRWYHYQGEEVGIGLSQARAAVPLTHGRWGNHSSDGAAGGRVGSQPHFRDPSCSPLLPLIPSSSQLSGSHFWHFRLLPTGLLRPAAHIQQAQAL